MTAVDELRRSIEDRLGQIENETTALRRALDALSGPVAKPTTSRATASPTPQTATRTAKATATRTAKATATPTAKATATPTAEKLAALLAETGDGSSTTELVDQTGGERDQILTLLRELEQTGQVRRSGMRRGTRWHAITDEDRISQRVAELEAQQAVREQAPPDGTSADAAAAG